MSGSARGLFPEDGFVLRDNGIFGYPFIKEVPLPHAFCTFGCSGSMHPCIMVFNQFPCTKICRMPYYSTCATWSLKIHIRTRAG